MSTLFWTVLSFLHSKLESPSDLMNCVSLEAIEERVLKSSNQILSKFMLAAIFGLILGASTAQANLVTVSEDAYFVNFDKSCGLAFFSESPAEFASVGLVWEDEFISMRPMISELRVPGEDNFTEMEDGDRGNRHLFVQSSVSEDETTIESLSFAFVKITGIFFSKERTVGTCENAVPVTREEFESIFKLQDTDFFN